jgi:hypothetical protein
MIKFFSIIIIFASSAFAQESPYLKFVHDNDFTGNDYGYTGAIDLEYGTVHADGWTGALRFNSALYSQRVIPYGNPANPSYAPFTDWASAPANAIALPKGVQNARIQQSTTLSGIVSFRQPDSAVKWIFEGGVTQSESRSGYIPGVAGFQQAIHRLVHATQIDLISDGKKTQYGIFIRPSLQIESGRYLLNIFALAPRARITFSVDTEGERTFVAGAAGISAAVTANASRAGFLFDLLSEVEGQMATLHKQVILQELLNVNLDQTTIFAGVSLPLTSTGYSEFYTTPYVDQDPVMKVGFQIWF